MSMIDVVRADMVAAMKAKEKEKKEVLSMLLADLKNYEINNRVELTDEAAAQVVLKQIKQLKETLSLTPADRTDIINECNFSISVLQNYAPEMMDKDAIEKVIKETLAELSIEKPTPICTAAWQAFCIYS